MSATPPAIPITDQKSVEKDGEILKRENALTQLQKQLDEKELDLLRQQLTMLGYPEAKAKKKNNKDVLLSLIDEQKERNDAEKTKTAASKTPKINSGVLSSSLPTVQFPDGSSLEAAPVEEKLNEGMSMAHLINPRLVPRHALKFNKDTRLNTLPPDQEFPYERIIA